MRLECHWAGEQYGGVKVEMLLLMIKSIEVWCSLVGTRLSYFHHLPEVGCLMRLCHLMEMGLRTGSDRADRLRSISVAPANIDMETVKEQPHASWPSLPISAYSLVNYHTDTSTYTLKTCSQLYTCLHCVHTNLSSQAVVLPWLSWCLCGRLIVYLCLLT